MLDYANYIARCIELARHGAYYVAPNPMVGAVLVSGDGRILAEGYHRQFGGPHAEVDCFNHLQPCDEHLLPESTLYVSLEPCSHYGKTPPCALLIISKHVRRVVVGMLDPNPKVAGRGVQMLREAGIEVVVGVMEKECRELNKRFLMLHEHHRPYVILKWAQTADGYLDICRTEPENGPLVISHKVTKQLVHQMRAENMAIMVGTHTAVLDNPGLKTTRWSGRNPIRVLLDRHQVVGKDSKIFSSDAETIVYRDNTDWSFVLNDLADRGVHSLIVEGGAKLLNTIIESGVYDEIHVEVSPLKLDKNEGVCAPCVQLPAQPDMTLFGHQIYMWSRA